VSAAVLSLGFAFGIGCLLVVQGWRGTGGPLSALSLPSSLNVPRPEPATAAAALGVGIVVLVLTRWPVLAVSAAGAAWWFSNSRSREQHTTIECTDAIATWAEMLRDATGTSRGIEGVLVSTAATAPLPIRDHVVRLARRLSYESIETVLGDLADDLDDPNGDLIVAAFGLAATSGGRDLRVVLDDVAVAARDDARMRRRVEVSREKPRSDMRQVIGTIVLVIALLSLGPSRGYLAPYGTVGGQLVMAVAAGLWIGGFVGMARLARVPPLRRILTRTEAATQ
jgi:hypothetical protein